MSQPSPLQQLWRHASGHRRKVVTATTFSVLNKLCDVAPELLIGVAVDVVVNEGHRTLVGRVFGVEDRYQQLSILAGITVVVWILESITDYISYADKLWRSLRHAVREQLLSLADADIRVIALHDGMVPSLILGGVPEAKIQVIRNPIRPFLQERVRAEDNREILYIGRLSSEKGPDLAAQAAQRAGRPIRLIGAGPLADTLPALAPDAILDGWKTHAEIAERCRSARMLVLPSRWAEPYGLVLGEALWSGLPVIVSDTALLADEVVQAGAGLSVKVTDLTTLLMMIERHVREKLFTYL